MRAYTNNSLSISISKGRLSKTGFPDAFILSNCLLLSKNMLVAGVGFFYTRDMILNIFILGISMVLYFWAMIRESAGGSIKASGRALLLITGIFFLWVLSYIMNSVFFYEYSNIIVEFRQFVIYCLPALLFLPSVRNCDDLLRSFYRYLWPMFLCATFSVFSILLSHTMQGMGSRYDSYSMSFGRAVLVVAILMFSKWFGTGKSLYFFCGAISVLYIFMFGSRFPLICVVFYFVWKWFSGRRDNNALIFTIIIMLAFAAIIFFRVYGSSLYVYFSSKGLNIRSLALIVYGKYNYDDGRIDIYSRMIEGINQSPVFGFGAGGGEIVLNNGLSHSFVLDLFANLGYVVGGIFLLWAFTRIIKVYRHYCSDNGKEFLRICLSMFIPICLIQTTFWTATYFWISLAISFGLRRTQNKKRNI